MDEKPVLFFDENCHFCRLLAEHTRRRFRGKLETASWDNSDSIGLQLAGATYTGDQAWSELLRLDPHLSSLDWLARKLGLQVILAKSIRRSSEVLRWLCRSCG